MHLFHLHHQQTQVAIHLQRILWIEKVISTHDLS